MKHWEEGHDETCLEINKTPRRHAKQWARMQKQVDFGFERICAEF